MKLVKNIKKIMNLSVFLVICGNNISAFNSITHSYVTHTSIETLCNLYKNIDNISKNNCELLDIINKYSDYINEYSLRPDEDENQGAFKNHFYNPDTEKNFASESDSSALVKCTNHYDNAVSNFVKVHKNNKIKEKDYSKSMEELGRSIHFMEDCSTAVHTGYDELTDSVTKLSLHMSFEKVCDEICEKIKCDISKESLKYYENNLLKNIVHASSVTSSDNFYRLENINKNSDILENNNKKFYEEAKGSIENAQQSVTGLVHKFICDVSQKILSKN